MTQWWRYFGSQELADLIDRGIANNPDMRIATLRVAQAKARADQAQAGQLPTISAPFLAGKGAVPVGTGVTQSQQSVQGSIRGDWRLDVWGEQSALAESANLQLWRAAFERDNVQRNMAASLASSYIEYVSLNDRLRVARETESLLSSMLSTIEKRVAAGDATLSELEQQKAAIFAARAVIPGLEQQREDAINSIAFVVGTVPGSLKLSDVGLDSLALPSVVPGLPSSLLLRRPDVRMVEARLLAADADIDVARARVLPPIDLAAQAGYSGTVLSQFFQPKAFFWNALTNISISIFDGGRRAKEKEFSESVHEEMVETYARTIYQAVREVESALAAIRLAGKRRDVQEDASISARRAWEISNQIYAVGGVDYMTLLDTQRTYNRYLDEFQRTQVEHYRGYISLFHALGGGVKQGGKLVGKGNRPAQSEGGKMSQAASPEASSKPVSVDGVNWGGSGSWQIENFWQVELAGLYHRNTIGSAWRDLRVRYPDFMENRTLRPRLSGRIEDSVDGQEAWYRLYVAKFSSAAAAQAFCKALQADQQRCRVVSSRSDETVTAEPGESKTDARKTGAAAVPASSAAEAPPQEKVAYAVQLGAFSNLENATLSRDFWQHKGYDSYISENRDGDGHTWYSVRTGVFSLRTEGAALAQSIRRKEDAPVFLVPTVIDASGKPAVLDVAAAPASNSPSQVPMVPEPPEDPRPMAELAASKAPAVRNEGREKTAYAVQLGAFASLENAAVSYDFWQAKGYDTYVSEIRDGAGRTWYAVRSGAFPVRRKASALAQTLGRKEDVPAMVVLSQVDSSGHPLTVDVTRPARPMASKQVSTDLAAKELSPAIPDNSKAVAVTPAPKKQRGPAYSVQLGAFSSLENAAKSLSDWQGKGYEVYVCELRDGEGRARYAVRSGRFAQRREASALLKSIGGQNQLKPMLVPALLGQDGQLATVNVRHLLEGQN